MELNMKNENDILDQFDNIKNIEPSADWNEKLFQRIEHSSHRSDNLTRNLVLTAVIILLAFNLFSLSNTLLNDRSQQHQADLNSIASEYLITTNNR